MTRCRQCDGTNGGHYSHCSEWTARHEDTNAPPCKDCGLRPLGNGKWFHKSTCLLMTSSVPEFLKKPSVLDRQVGGEHYKKFGDYQPWEVLFRWLSPAEFRGYMKGTAVAYLARELDKGGIEDISKAAHTLQALVEYEGKRK